MMKLTKSLVAAALALTLSAAAFARGNEARVRVLHASPDAPAVDVLVNGGLAFEDVAFTEFAGYATLPAGTYNVQVVPTGATSPAVIDADLSLFYNTDYTVVAVNFLDQIEPLVLVDTNTPVAPVKSRVRFVHASPDAPAVDIRVANGGPYLFTNVSFKGVGDYVTVPSGTYDLEVTVAGTDTVALSLPNVPLDGGTTYSVFAVGTLADRTLGVALGVDNVSPARATGLRRR
jgi:hypothetical protein